MDANFLNKVKQQEREQKEIFSDELPYFYMEMAVMLLDQCKDEFENHKQTKSLINDLFELRRDKLLRIMKKIDVDTPVQFLSTVGSAELNPIEHAFIFKLFS